MVFCWRGLAEDILMRIKYMAEILKNGKQASDYTNEDMLHFVVLYNLGEITIESY